MKYFEFNSHEYYGLIAVDEEQVMVPDMNVEQACVHVAIEVYEQGIAGDSFEQVLEEGTPVEVSIEEAKSRHHLATGGKLSETDSYFETIKHGEIILIDGCLV